MVAELWIGDFSYGFQLKEEEKLVGIMSIVERTGSGQGLSQPTPSQAAFPSGQVCSMFGLFLSLHN
jgi:hypothetical protein